jgi:hypothetical protein
MTSGEATWEGSTLKAFCSFVAFPEYGGNGSPTDTTGLALLDPPAIHALLPPPWGWPMNYRIAGEHSPPSRARAVWPTMPTVARWLALCGFG